ncbi:hypothetical protein, partial [Intestinimonas butyriciproducens]|uniref:hypothetical protein n=1 Tax=Intestinimonas butyriciproducens TaxID=1297617 RepID=UPI001A9BE2F0
RTIYRGRPSVYSIERRRGTGGEPEGASARTAWDRMACAGCAAAGTATVFLAGYFTIMATMR